MEYEPVTVELKREACPLWCAKLQMDQKLDDKTTAVASATKKTVVVGFASGAMKMFSIPGSQGQPSSKQGLSPALDTLPPHDQLVSRLTVSRDGIYLVSAAMDGQIR